MGSSDARRREGCLDLEDYGALADGRSVALSGADGSIDWWCVPAFDSWPLFDRILDPEAGGRFSITPAAPFRTERRYRPDSNVLETDFVTETGRARMVEALTLGDLGSPFCGELVRRVEGLEGSMRFALRLSFARGPRDESAEVGLDPEGARFSAGSAVGVVRVSRGVSLRTDDDASVRAEFAVEAGQSEVVGVAADGDRATAAAVGDMDRRLARTEGRWRDWAGGLTVPGPRAGVVRRSLLAQMALFHARTGAIVASPTTSLPELMGGERNWDFRFAWVRDAVHGADALLACGAVAEATRTFNWLISQMRDHGPRVVFTVEGEVAPMDREIDRPGYRGSRPVHVGNLASAQRQHGTFGDVLELAWRLSRRGLSMDSGTQAILCGLVDACADDWQAPDAGIWELSELRPYANSRLACWQALDRAVRLAGDGRLPDSGADRWRKERDRIADWIGEHCWREDLGTYVAWPGSDVLDASLPLAVRLEFGLRDRLERTVEAVDRGLRTGRFHHRMSGVEESEGCFIACSFWLVEARARLGQRRRAAEAFDDLIEALGGVGIYPEMVEPGSERWLANMPLGLTHAAVVRAALALEAGG